MKSKVIYFIVVVFVVLGSIVVGWAVGVIIKEDIKPYPNINQTLSNTTEMEDYLLLSYSFDEAIVDRRLMTCIHIVGKINTKK